MPLIVEDGSNVPDAVSYVTEAEARSFASMRGFTLPADDAECSVLLIKAMDYIEAREQWFAGVRTYPTQPLSNPRTGMVINGVLQPPDAIAKSLKNAQCQLAIDAMTIDLSPNGTGPQIIRQKVDVIETEWANAGTGAAYPDLTLANGYLGFLYPTSGDMFTVPILRT